MGPRVRIYVLDFDDDLDDLDDDDDEGLNETKNIMLRDDKEKPGTCAVCE